MEFLHVFANDISLTKILAVCTFARVNNRRHQYAYLTGVLPGVRGPGLGDPEGAVLHEGDPVGGLVVDEPALVEPLDGEVHVGVGGHAAGEGGHVAQDHLGVHGRLRDLGANLQWF